MTAWTWTLALGMLVCPLGCVVSVDDGDDDAFGGSLGVSGRGGSAAGAGGRSGNGGSGGSSGSGGSELLVPPPTCDAEPMDVGDECVQCLKRSCCTEWLGCDDQSCTDEWTSVAVCLEPQEFPGEDELGMCISEASAAEDGLVQANTQILIECALTLADDAGLETLCSSECFGSDIFYE